MISALRHHRMIGEKYDYPVDTSNPFIMRDYNKCILCQKCVRVCKDIQGIEAIKMTNRGFETKVATAYDTILQDSNCVFCGQCVQACPVGALTETKSKGPRPGMGTHQGQDNLSILRCRVPVGPSYEGRTDRQGYRG